MVIKDSSIPPWNKNNPNKFYQCYTQVVDNIQNGLIKRYSNQKILLIDNTYLDVDQVSQIITNNNCDINVVISLLDPPYTWHYLIETLGDRFPNKQFRYIGNESPDMHLLFWFILCYNEFEKYQDQEVLPTEFKHVFLNYNFMPHDHRVAFINKLRERDLLKLGYWSLGQENHVISSAGREQNLGNLDLWRGHFLNIVSKTCFRPWSEPLILGEKVLKPIIGLRPFILNGSPRYYQEFQKLGFDCFEDLWPVAEMCKECATVEETMAKNHNIICDVIQELSTIDLNHLYKKLLPRLYENRNTFYTVAKNLKEKFYDNVIEF